MHTDDVRQLSAWLEATDIDMLELQGPGERLCLRRNGTRIEIVPDGAQGATAARTAVTAGWTGPRASLSPSA